jgi:hypothetical protein
MDKLIHVCYRLNMTDARYIIEWSTNGVNWYPHARALDRKVFTYKVARAAQGVATRLQKVYPQNLYRVTPK